MKKVIYLGFQKERFEYETIVELRAEAKKYDIIIGHGCEIGNGCILGKGCKIGHGCEFGNGCKIGDYCTFGNSCTLGFNLVLMSRARIKSETNIYKIINLSGYYKYQASAIKTNTEILIQLGCFTRNISEWDNNFWNNDIEFPEGSPQGQERLNAYQTIKGIAEKVFKQ